jgi:hypothetical protein
LDIIEIELAAAQTGKIFQFNTGVNTDTLAAIILATLEIMLATLRHTSSIRPFVRREVKETSTEIIKIQEMMEMEAIVIAIPA